MANESHSIWNENPETYFTVKLVYSAFVTLIYPFAHYCVLAKSPKSFGLLKWIIYVHCICFTCEWLGNVFFIDVYDFQPSVFVKINGILKNYIHPIQLYQAYVILEGITETSGLILFTSRVLLIVDLYRPRPSIQRRICEFLIYCVVFAFGMWAIPMIIWQLPDQKFAKLNVIKTHEFYPDCIWDSNVIAITSTDSTEEDVICVLIVANCVSIGFAIFISAKIAFYMLSRRMINQSEATKKMHKKFNERTILQAILYFTFCCVPFSVLYLTILLEVHIPGSTYFIDIFSENHPTACAVSLFLFYDPYQYYLMELLGIKLRQKISNASTILVEKVNTISRNSNIVFI
ncbi:Serpentine Receptor, class H [Caenorhabditis elegans]|uniref:Serpentine Receptor, class H n=1 Tax=Caenorhabditis elegans TaxID=6239 RepID=O16906_CAEEL|nr:Serpentine Receptor, class H [Caenorhabditis elegans]CCD66300.1 Serpentine Receptor, class H [Caenorhabditis elegans]|eukprot:NP_503793.1 Serpentine Receptor, class H [Caenorhabditis elegans]